MTRLWYGKTPADFAINLGADVDIVDGTGTPTGDTGSTVVVPLTVRTFDAYTDAALTTVATDLLDAAGTPITQVSSETDFADRGTLPRFQGPDGHEGPLWLSSDGVNGYRMEPESGPLYTRVGAVETSVGALVTTDLDDVSETLPTEGQVLKWDNTLGVYAPGSATGTGTVTSVDGKSPDGSGAVTTVPSDNGSATAADMAIVKARTYVLCKPSGGGYESKPSGWVNAIRPGDVQPTSQLAEYDIWAQPETTT